MNHGRGLIKQLFLSRGRFVATSGVSLSQRSFSKVPALSSSSKLLKGYHQSSSLGLSTVIMSRGFASSMGFEEAVQKSTSMKDPDNMTKLKMYALYKQATVGKATGKRPGAMDFVKRAKFDAWNDLGDMSQEEAKKQYVEIVTSGLPSGGGGGGEGQQEASTGSSGSSGEVPGLEVKVEGGVRRIRLNRPEKFNALTREMYRGILESLKEANDDPNTNVIVMTGTGKFYCSGNDLSNFMNVTDPVKMAKDGRDLLLEFVDSFIYCKKPLIGVINGPAVGISVTVLGMFDSVFSSDLATFTSPFSSLGQSPEGCSSYTFPRIMGYAKASELLYFNQKISAVEAEQLGLITKVIPHDRLIEETEKRIQEMAELPIKSLVYAKELVRGPQEQELLHQVNVRECDRLQERWVSEDCMNAIQKFFMRKSKV